MGIEFYEKIKTIDNKKIQVKIWDTAGQEKFAAIAKSYYQRAHGIILTCAINNKKSFNNLRTWLNSIKDTVNEENIQLIIIANKCDLEHEREVPKSEIAEKAKELDIEYFETSAKDNTNIDEAFDTITNKVYNKVYNKSVGINLSKGNKKDSGCCK
jgi:small GTP-binding protein